MDHKIRTISEGEESLLQDFLYQAVFVPEGVPAPPKSIISQPELQIYNRLRDEKRRYWFGCRG